MSSVQIIVGRMIDSLTVCINPRRKKKKREEIFFENVSLRHSLHGGEQLEFVSG